MNKFAAINLTKRINAKATQLCLVGLDREVFCFIASGHGEIGFESFRRQFDAQFIPAIESLAKLMQAGAVFQQSSSSRYYSVAV